MAAKLRQHSRAPCLFKDNLHLPVFLALAPDGRVPLPHPQSIIVLRKRLWPYKIVTTPTPCRKAAFHSARFRLRIHFVPDKFFI